MITRIFCLLSFCLLTVATQAEVFKSIDEDGNVIYTDNPRGQQAIEKVELPSINRQPAIHVPPIEKTQEAAKLRHSITITAPANGAQIPTGEPDVQIFANIKPFLNADHRIRFIHNGKISGKASKSPVLLLSSVHRGEHQISAQLVNKDGKIIARSKAVTFYVQRHSVNR